MSYRWVILRISWKYHTLVDDYLHAAIRWFVGRKNMCSRGGCFTFRGVRLEDSRTAYAWDGMGENPNAPTYLCRQCAKEHHTYWDGMWADYYSGII